MKLKMLLVALVVFLVGSACSDGSTSTSRGPAVEHYLIEARYPVGTTCPGEGPPLVALSRDLGSQSSWLDIDADGTIDAMSDPSRILFEGAEATDGRNQWLSVPSDDSDPITVFLRATRIGSDIQLLFPGIEDPIPLWSWVRERQDEGQTSPARGVEGEPRSPEVSWSLDEAGQVESVSVTPEETLPGEASSVAIHRLSEDDVVDMPSISSASSIELAEVPALPYILSFPTVDPDCYPSDGYDERRDCVERLVDDLTVGEWIDRRGLNAALQITECTVD